SVMEEDAVTTPAYNNSDLPIAITHALGHSDRYQRDAIGNALFHTNRSNHTFANKLDAAKRLTHEISPEPTLTDVLVDENGKLTHQEKRTQVVKETQFNKNGLPTCIIEGEGLAEERRIHLTYNAQNK